MEPYAAIAGWQVEMLTLRAASQMLKYNLNELADALGIAPKNVRILSPFVGSGFGSKLGIAPDAVAAALVETDMTDIGTGTYAILTQIAAEMLGLPASAVEIRLGDSDLPKSAGSGGSWGAPSAGSSVFLACEVLRRQIAATLDGKDNDLILKDGLAMLGNRKMPLSDVIDGTLQAIGTIEPGEIDEAAHQATFGAFFAEVRVSAVRARCGCAGCTEASPPDAS